MKRLFALLLACLLPLPALAGGITASDITANDITANDITANGITGYTDVPLAQIDAAVDELFAFSHTRGGTLVLGYGGEIIYARDYGDAATKTPVSARTCFRLASVAKMVSALGVLKLAEDGLLDLDGDISDLLGYAAGNPYAPETPITPRHLLTHTSGLIDSGEYGANSTLPLQRMLALEDAKNARNFLKNSAPGAQYSYSNFGGGLFGSMIEAASGQSVNAYMTQAIFAPLGIDAAYSPTLLSDPLLASAVYSSANKMTSSPRKLAEAYAGYEDTCDPERHYTATRGYLWMSGRDLCKLMLMLANGGVYQGTRVLGEQTVAAMLEDQTAHGVTAQSPYGLGISYTDSLLPGSRYYGHQGVWSKFVTNAYFDPESGFCIVLLTNYCDRARTDGVSNLCRRMFAYASGLLGLE